MLHKKITMIDVNVALCCVRFINDKNFTTFGVHHYSSAYKSIYVSSKGTN